MFRGVPKKVWLFVGFCVLFTLNAAWTLRPDSPYSYYLSRPDIEITNLKIDDRVLRRKPSRMITSVTVRGELTNRSSRTVTGIDLGLTVYSCRERNSADYSACDVAFTATISPMFQVAAAPDETKPFEYHVYLSPDDLPVRRNIRIGHKVHFVHTR